MGTILIIDDLPFEVKLLHVFLSNAGFNVRDAKNGTEGIGKAEFEPPDLILLDVNMPGIDGFEVCKRLKSKEKTKSIPIMFMTVRTEISDIVKGFKVGAADYIIKPFEHDEVLARVTTQLELYQLQQQLTLQNQQLLGEINQRKQVEESLQTERNVLAKRTVELGEANAKLARAVQLKDEFLANMSHELRTPLNAVLGISEVLQEQVYGSLNDKQCKLMHTIGDSGHHLLELINDVLDLAKIEAEKFTLKLNTISVNEVCQASLRMIKEMAYKKPILVSTSLDYAVDTIQADELRLKQILINLLSNAVKFTPEGGSIKLVVNGDVEHGVVDFSVQDTGIGIAEDDMKNLFEPFVQLDGSLNRAQEGTGLGLSLVYRFTEMHGGSISVESEVDQGSSFTVSLPWRHLKLDELSIPETERLTMAHEPDSALIDNHHSSRVILIAEDQEITSQVLSDYLTTLGYQILIARNGVEAVEQSRAMHPDLILMDIHMPLMSGLEAIKEIRADTDIATIPIIALTALAMPSDKEHCLQAGANEYLSKPVSMKKLVAAIEGLL
ncbi:MAG: hypothetical protein DRR19_28540 [Candidatus Parabeggiatoa sp. nov. 1]|nr:MAG: hypothetical protein DRR19_28540 [Gammaproteobacteria bacterium]